MSNENCRLGYLYSLFVTLKLDLQFWCNIDPNTKVLNAIMLHVHGSQSSDSIQ